MALTTALTTYHCLCNRNTHYLLNFILISLWGTLLPMIFYPKIFYLVHSFEEKLPFKGGCTYTVIDTKIFHLTHKLFYSLHTISLRHKIKLNKYSLHNFFFATKILFLLLSCHTLRHSLRLYCLL